MLPLATAAGLGAAFCLAFSPLVPCICILIFTSCRCCFKSHRLAHDRQCTCTQPCLPVSTGTGGGQAGDGLARSSGGVAVRRVLAPCDDLVLSRQVVILVCVSQAVSRGRVSPRGRTAQRGTGTCQVHEDGRAPTATPWLGEPENCRKIHTAPGLGGTASNDRCLNTKCCQDRRLPRPWLRMTQARR